MSAIFTNILIDKNGNLISGSFDIGNVNTYDEMILGLNSSYDQILFQNQISFEFFNEIQKSPNSNTEKIPVYSSVVTSGLSGNISLLAKPTPYVPYPIPMSPSKIDISKNCYCQFSGLCQQVIVNCENIVGANYINIIVSRN